MSGRVSGVPAPQEDSATIDGVVNLNDRVWVRLTELGWKIYDDSIRAVGLDPAPYRKYLGMPGGWQKFQLWELMQIYGPYCHMGMPGVFFDRMELRFTDPTAEPPAEQDL